jgi:hypothetical protein
MPSGGDVRRSPSIRIPRSRSLTALCVVAALGLLGCVGGGADCAELPGRIELTLTADTLEPSDPAVCRGEEVTLVVTPEADGVLHIHGYDAEVPATQVTAGEPIEIVFTATRSGQFPIEFHAADDSRGVSVGLLTVHEP